MCACVIIEIERLADADIDDGVGLEGLDLQKLRQEIGRRAIEHDRLDLEAEVLLLVLLLGLLGEADAVVGGLGEDADALPLVLLDPARARRPRAARRRRGCGKRCRISWR